jgi:chitosanase
MAVSLCLLSNTSISSAAANDANSKKNVIQKLTSVFENSTPNLQYTYIENINDGRGYTFGFAGFCSGTYDGTEFLQEYQKLSPHNTLVKYIPIFEKIDKMTHPDGKCANVEGLEDFPEDFAACGNDADFVQAQQNIVDKEYWNPSQNTASKIGAKYAITRGELYDTYINHGADGAEDIINKTNTAMGGSPATGVDEKAWLDKFLQIRLKVLQADATWQEAVDRVKAYQNLLKQGNVDLKTPMTIKCYGDTFTIK